MFHRFALPLLITIALIFLVVAAVPVLGDPSAWVLGDADGRAPFALWSSWVRAEMWVHGSATPLTGFPKIAPIPEIYSPTHFGLFAAISRLTGTGPSGAGMAWNMTILVWLGIGIAGTVSLIRRLVPTASAITLGVGIVAIPASLGWSGAIVGGDVADLPALLLPAQLALLDRWVGKERDLLSGVGSALLLCLAALCRWQMTFFVLAMALPMAVAIGRRIQDRGDFMRWGGALLPGFVVGSAHIWLSDGATMAGPVSSIGALRAPLWSLLATDSMSPLGPWLLALPALGILILAMVATIERPFANIGWWLCAVWGLMLAGGTSATPFIAPGRRLADVFSVLQNITDWSGVVPLIAIPIGVLAAKGAAALDQRHSGSIAIALALAALADQSHHLIGMHTDDRRFEVRSTRVVSIAFEDVPEGAVLELPFAPEHSAARGISLLDQRIHRRAVSIGTSASAEGAIAVSYLARTALRLQLDPGPMPSPQVPLQASEFLCASADITTLLELGFTSVAYRGIPDPAHPTWQMLRLVLGQPVFADRSFTVWRLDSTTKAVLQTPCALPPTPPGFTPDRGISHGGDERPSTRPAGTRR
jgi:hypothetical protein